ncbi:hypothetical protein HMPREF0973_01362 [Prevotella veroralis F0319]|uniref:Uncharacterized protein n=1 Tax=Prevotella veroralis F0319 TaxID=649761 RepID=C9MP24_9BACT|nr:hypothetical protein HMPREF0973_01362 [Prevotella veroralis F0319]
MKRRLLHSKETPSSKLRGRLLVFTQTIPADETQPRYTPILPLQPCELGFR